MTGHYKQKLELSGDMSVRNRFNLNLHPDDISTFVLSKYFIAVIIVDL